jgi:transcriptional regulator with XRE-family HTH domain
MISRTRSENPVTAPANPAPHPGVVAGAVLRAARLSAGLSVSRLAAEADVDESTIRRWEDGSTSLAFAPYSQIEQLRATLQAAGSELQLIADLDVATWCDLVILALTGDGDVTCLLADPVTHEDSFRELLGWALTGRVPSRYRRYADSRPLVNADAAMASGVAQLVDLVRRLGLAPQYAELPG